MQYSQLENEIEDLETNVSYRNSELLKLRESNQEYNSKLNNIAQEGTKLILEEKQLRNDTRMQELDLEKAETLQKELRARLSTLEMKMKNINIETSKLEIEVKDRMTDNAAEINLLSEQKISLESRYKILRTLLYEKYITNPYYDVCKVLKAPGIKDLDTLTKSSGVSRETVIETLEELHKRGITEYNESTGSFKVINGFGL